VVTRTVDLATAPLPEGPFELILAGTVMNELETARRLPLAQALLSRLAPDGALIVLEPALRETSRALHELRDGLIQAGAHVVAPCTRAGHCPALDDPRDWCHEDRPFAPPPRLRQLSAATGLRDGGLKFAYLVVRREPARRDLPAGARALRVVSEALDQKGNVTRMVCGDDGRAPLTLLKRTRSPALKVLGRSRRGDVLIATADGELDKERS
jgi:ribosomal protein RSM22 (predicted rRNA methylase)